MFCIADILYAHHAVVETYFTVNRNEAKILTVRTYRSFSSDYGLDDPVYGVFASSMRALGYSCGRIISDDTTGEIVVTEIYRSRKNSRVRMAEGGLYRAEDAIEASVKALEDAIKMAAKARQGVKV